jgi:hypothetical protein
MNAILGSIGIVWGLLSLIPNEEVVSDEKPSFLAL